MAGRCSFRAPRQARTGPARIPTLGTGQYMQWIVLALVIGASIVSWIIRQVQEERERRQVRQEAASREMERLRTGREPGVGAESAEQMQRAQELQARRQQQLQELRRRQQERARQGQQQPMRVEEARVGPSTSQTVRIPGQTGTGTTRQTPIIIVPGSSGTTVPTQRTQTPARRTPAPQPQARPRPQPARPQQQRAQTPQRTVQPRQTRTLFPQAAPAPARPVAPEAPPGPRRIAPAREAYEQRPVGPKMLETIKPKTSAEWRRAIIMHEMLSKPITERENHL